MTFSSESNTNPQTLSWDSLVLDEGHAAPNSARYSSSSADFSLIQRLERADRLLYDHEFDHAADELAAVTERVMSQKLRLRKSLDQAIARLTTLGSKASPPHPKALVLVRLRKSLTA